MNVTKRKNIWVTGGWASRLPICVYFYIFVCHRQYLFLWLIVFTEHQNGTFLFPEIKKNWPPAYSQVFAHSIAVRHTIQIGPRVVRFLTLKRKERQWEYCLMCFRITTRYVTFATVCFLACLLTVGNLVPTQRIYQFYSAGYIFDHFLGI